MRVSTAIVLVGGAAVLGIAGYAVAKLVTSGKGLPEGTPGNFGSSTHAGNGAAGSSWMDQLAGLVTAGANAYDTIAND